MLDGAKLRHIRRSLRLTQAEFSDTYGIPIGSLRNWEQNRTCPDTTAETLLWLIEAEPVYIATLLKRRPPAST